MLFVSNPFLTPSSVTQTFDERGDGHVKYSAFLQVFDEAIRFSPEVEMHFKSTLHMILFQTHVTHD
jgi:hypothetical protein